MWDQKWGVGLLVFAFSAAACSGVDREPSYEPAGRSLLPAQPVPAVGPEIGTEAPVLVPSYFGHNPELASDGNGFLSVKEVDARIRAVRVDGAGQVLDAEWLDFGAEGVEQYYPSVAFGGGRYLVTWSESVTDDDGNWNSVVRGRFARTDGTLEGDESFVVSSGQALYSSVDFDGEHFLLAYLALGGDGVNDVRSVLLNPDGTRVADSERTLTTSGSVSNPRLAVGAANALVTWEEYVHSDTLGDTSSIHGVRVGRDGAALDPTSIALSTGVRSEQAADVAAGPDGFLVVWQVSDASAVRGSIVSDTGSVSAEDFQISHGSEGAGAPSAVFDGTVYGVAWTDARDQQSLYGTQVTVSGVVASEDKKLSTGTPRYVGFSSDHTNLAWNGSRLLLTYLAADPSGIEGSLLTPDLEVNESPIALTAIPSSQGYPYSTFDGENYVVAWTDERDSDLDMSVRAVRISDSGSVLDPAAVVVSTADKPAFGFNLGSARMGSSLFFWSGTDRDPQQRLFSADGSLGGVQPFTTQNGSVVPAVASNGSGYLTVFADGGSSDTASLFGHLLDGDGNSGPEFRIDASTLNTGPFVFPSEGQYLVAYARSGMRLVTISPTGALGTILDLAPHVTTVGGASSGANSLVTFNGEGEGYPLLGRFLVSGAFSGESFEISATSAGWASALAWDGAAYWAVWESPEHHLQARSIGPDGTLGPTATLVSEEVYAPVLASDGDGQLLLSYSKLAGNRLSNRVVSRIVGRGAGDPSGTGGSGGSGGSGEAGSSGSGGETLAGMGGESTAGTGSGGLAAGASGTPGGGSPNGAGGTTSASGGSSGAATSGASGAAGSGGSGPQPSRCSVGAAGGGMHETGSAALFGLVLALAAARRRRVG